MARDPDLGKFLSHIKACNSACLPGERLGFHIGIAKVGYVRREFADRLAKVSPDIALTDRVTLDPAATGRLNAIAKAAGCHFRDEDFDVRETPDGPSLGVLDRGAVPDFGVLGVGVHVNGLVRGREGWSLWVGKRASDKRMDPDKLDNLVGGGVAAGQTPLQTLLKEGAEEAMLPASLAGTAQRVATIAYSMEREEGLRRDVLCAYDLVVPEAFIPHPADGEVAHFSLWPLSRVFETVRDSDDFKFNVNLVLIDLFIRFGLVQGEMAATLRQALG